MQNPCGARPLSSLFGTVSMGKTIQTLDVLASYNLFMGSPGTVAHQGRTADAPLLNRMPRALSCGSFFVYKP